jgi:hypothetical protein
MIEEVIYISEFNVKLDGTIAVRKTTDVTKDGAVIASSHWRTVLQPNDPSADEVLDEPYYHALATLAWESLPEQPIAPLAEAEEEADAEAEEEADAEAEEEADAEEEAEEEAEEPTETQENDE